MKNIKYNDIDLPEWLFYRDESRAAGASPTDSLNISASMNGGNAWTSSTSPSAGHKPKVVVFTKASLIKELNKSDLLGMASWFRANGFKVFIACEGDQEEGVFKEVDDKIDFRLFDKLRYIDQDTDNEKLAKLGVARDKLAIVESEKMTELNEQLNLYQTLDAENYHAISRGYKLALHRDFDDLPVPEDASEKDKYMRYLFKYDPKKAIRYIKSKQVGKFDYRWIQDCRDPNALVDLSKLLDDENKPIIDINEYEFIDKAKSLKIPYSRLFEFEGEIKKYSDFRLRYDLCYDSSEKEKLLIDNWNLAGPDYMNEAQLLKIHYSRLIKGEIKTFYDLNNRYRLCYDSSEKEQLLQANKDLWGINTIHGIAQFVGAFGYREELHDSIIKNLTLKDYCKSYIQLPPRVLRDMMDQLNSDGFTQFLDSIRYDRNLLDKLTEIFIAIPKKHESHKDTIKEKIVESLKNISFFDTNAGSYNDYLKCLSNLSLIDDDLAAELFQKTNQNIKVNDCRKILDDLENKKSKLYQAVSRHLDSFIATEKESAQEYLTSEDVDYYYLKRYVKYLDQDEAEKILNKNGSAFRGLEFVSALIEILHPSHNELIMKLIDENNVKINDGMELVALIKALPNKKEELLKRFFQEARENQDIVSLAKLFTTENQLTSYEFMEFIERYVPESQQKDCLDFYNNSTSPSIEDKPSLSTTELFVADLASDVNFNYLQKLLSEGKLQELAVIELASFNANDEHQKARLNEFIWLIKARCPKLKQLILPASAKEKAPEINIAANLVEYQKVQFITKKAPPNIDEVILVKEAKKPSVNRVNRQIGEKKKNKFYTSKNTSNAINTSANDGAKFYNDIGGELLNTEIDLDELGLRLRTSIVKRDLTQSLGGKTYIPQKYLTNANIQVLSDNDVASCKASTDDLYFQSEVKVNPGATVRLLSLDSEEELQGIFGANPKDIAIKKGDDGFFYATSNSGQAISFSYVLKAPIKAKYNEDDLSDEVKRLLSEYRNPASGFEPVASGKIPMPDFDQAKSQEWLEQVYKTRAGTCAHRCAAVQYKLSQLNPKPTIRNLVIDNNHERLEIRIEKDGGYHWVQVDLGGGTAVMAFSNDKAVSQEALTKSDSSPSVPSPSVPSEQKSQTNASPSLEEPQKDVSQNQDIPGKEIEAQQEQQKPRITKKQEREEFLAQMNDRQRALMSILTPESSTNSIKSQDELLEKTLGPGDKKKTLLITQSVDDHVALLSRKLEESHTNFCYLNDFNTVDFDKLIIALSKSDGREVPVSEKGRFERFLDDAKKAGDSQPVLIVNWDALNSKQRLQLNTMLDKERSIMGRGIPDKVRIIGVSSQLSVDNSFISRHDQILKSNISITQNASVQLEAQEAGITEVIIDLQGLEDWQKALFGNVSLKDNKIIWEQSDFVKSLSSDPDRVKKFKIINVPASSRDEIAQAINQGRFQYHDKYIDLPQNVKISVNSTHNDLQFNLFNAVNVVENVTFSGLNSKSKAFVVNTHLFDRLVTNKSIEGGKYTETKGLISEHSGKPLELFITSNLTDGQWYYLVSQAEKENVTLKLNLAPSVRLPASLAHKTEPSAKETSKQGEKETEKPVIYLAKSSESVVRALEKENKVEAGNVYSVEDFTYQQLIYKIDIQRSKDSFEQFSVIINPILQKLIEGKDVVLKGAFSEALCRYLEPILINGELELPDRKVKLSGKLSLIVENQSQDLFAHLPSGLVHQVSAEEEKTPSQPLQYQPMHEQDPDKKAAGQEKTINEMEIEALAAGKVDLIKKHSLEFIKQRETMLLEALKQSSIVQLVGESGVGKSRLLLGLQEKQSGLGIEIHNELSSTGAWLENKNKSSRPVLFIDEANIENKHLTMFEGLKHKKREILYDGKSVLPEGHKLVTAKNPESYGGGRNKQKLFDDDSVQEIHLKDFPVSYLYTSIMLPIYEEAIKSGKLDAKKLPEAIFAKDCANYFEIYIAKNKQAKEAGREHEHIGLTARELQEFALGYFRNQLNTQARVRDHQYTTTDDFIPTESNASARAALAKFIDVRKFQKEEALPAGGIGLNGVLIEGAPGTGKSAIIKYMLEQKGYQFKDAVGETKSGVAESKGNELVCYKIDASLSLEVKKAILLKAFNEGNAVWIDEINGCIDDGLEKLLNALLTGVDLEKKAPAKPGFMMFATANSAGLEGRSIVSPAIKHRCLSVKLEKDTEKDIQQILEKKLCQDKDTGKDTLIDIFEMAKHFVELRDNGVEINLRILLQKLDAIKGEYEISRDDYLHKKAAQIVAQIREKEKLREEYLQKKAAQKKAAQKTDNVNEKTAKAKNASDRIAVPKVVQPKVLNRKKARIIKEIGLILDKVGKGSKEQDPLGAQLAQKEQARTENGNQPPVPRSPRDSGNTR